ncbi:uncharacterized protein B0J16DRAFT_418287 [Fusarium flagelliforme]|uniref:uncharacterized protein n=1 Tax=Fusarium flagelliforme TaxID=2675880 RepID=UPI001E8CD2F0|nr:uncharacterized protein B0J16DRAFT_418287 [Fusarium flagelliforme]KAH7174856.1 hypothetical protein B0J16DRAFT_418287 [Fusarium flagelliforme]
MTAKSSARIDGQALLTAIWPDVPIGPSIIQNHYSVLLEHFEDELQILRQNRDHIVLPATEDICKIIQLVKPIRTTTRQQMLQAIRLGLPCQENDDGKLQRSVDFAIRVWLTMGPGSLETGRQDLLPWQDGQTLQELAYSLFKLSHGSKSREQSGSRIDPHLTAENLVSNYGYAINWTHNLADHLAIDWKYKEITIYEHKIHLCNHLRFPESAILPEDIAGEAIDTLNLLFPFQDDTTKRFLDKEKKLFYGLGFCNRPRNLDLDDYTFWRDRIEDLNYILRQPAVGLHQLRLDRGGNNMLQISAFWITVVLGLVTLISIAFAVGATVYGVKQYNISLKQYELSVAEACLDPAAREKLKQFCS